MRSISFQNLNNFIPQTVFEEKVLQFSQKWYNGTSDFRFFTSGSTGQPKEIILSREQLEISANQTINWLKLKVNDTVLINLPPDYIAGAMLLVRAFVAKMNIVLIEPAQDLSKSIQQIDQSIHLVSFVPNQWKIILKDLDDFSLNKIFQNAKGVLIGGANLDSYTKSLTNKRCHFPVFLTYGMTETVSHIAYQVISQEPTEYLQTLPGVEISKSTKGNLNISAPNTLYQSIETQDLVEIISPQTFKIVGRSNRIINSSGLKINPVEIEQILLAFFTSNHIFNDFFVAGIPDDFFGELVCIFVEGKIAFDLNQINSFLEKQIPKNKLPKRLVIVGHFNKTSSGKIDQIKTIQNVIG